MSSERHSHLTCPICRGSDIKKAGKRYIKGSIKRGIISHAVQRYRCKTCGVSVHKDGYFRGKFPLDVVQYAIALYRIGLSLEKIQLELKEKLSISVSSPGIRNWLIKANVPRRHDSINQKKRINRELVKVGVTTVVRFASSKQPGKIIVVQNDVVSLGGEE